MIEVTNLFWEHGAFLFIASVGLTTFTTIVRYFTVDKEKLSETKKKLEKHKLHMKKAQKEKDYKAMQQHQAKMLEATQEQAKAGMKPMLYTFIPIILIFTFLRGAYGDIGTLNDVSIAEILPEGVSEVHLEEIQSTWLNTSTSFDQNSNMGVLKISKLAHEWHWSHFGHHSGGTLKVSFVHDGKFDFRPKDTLVSYQKTDGSRQSLYSMHPDSLIRVSKSQYIVEGNKVSYTIDYENIDRYELIRIGGIRFGWLGFYVLSSFPISMILSKRLGLR